MMEVLVLGEPLFSFFFSEPIHSIQNLDVLNQNCTKDFYLLLKI